MRTVWAKHSEKAIKPNGKESVKKHPRESEPKEIWRNNTCPSCKNCINHRGKILKNDSKKITTTEIIIVAVQIRAKKLLKFIVLFLQLAALISFEVCGNPRIFLFPVACDYHLQNRWN
jgi:hypothetical protein